MPTNDFWKVTNKLSVLDKIRKKIVLDAFCVRCGIDNGSVFFSSRQVDAINFVTYTTVAKSLRDAFSIEFWYKTSVNFTSTAGVAFANARLVSGGQNVKVGFLNGKIICTVLKGSTEFTVTSATPYTQGDWAHICVTYDGTTVKIYQNSVLDANTLAIASNLDSDASNFYSSYLGSDKDQTELYVGALAEVRIWDRALLQSEILYNYPKRKGKNADLVRYYRLNETAGSLATIVSDYVNPLITTLINNDDDIYLQDDDYPPLKLGASFIAGRYSITSPVKFSFKYPCVKPEGANFMLCVMWVNEEGETQRYKLWDQDGVVMWPQAERYRGQVIAEDFWLEVWNQDGEEHCELEEEYTLYVSKVSLPTNERDSTNLELVDNPTIDNSIYQTFPLTPFPLTFEVDGFGTCASPVAENLDNMSDNLTLYGAAQT